MKPLDICSVTILFTLGVIYLLILLANSEDKSLQREYDRRLSVYTASLMDLDRNLHRIKNGEPFDRLETELKSNFAVFGSSFIEFREFDLLPRDRKEQVQTGKNLNIAVEGLVRTLKFCRENGSMPKAFFQEVSTEMSELSTKFNNVERDPRSWIGKLIVSFKLRSKSVTYLFAILGSLSLAVIARHLKFAHREESGKKRGRSQ